MFRMLFFRRSLQITVTQIGSSALHQLHLKDFNSLESLIYIRLGEGRVMFDGFGEWLATSDGDVKVTVKIQSL